MRLDDPSTRSASRLLGSRRALLAQREQVGGISRCTGPAPSGTATHCQRCPVDARGCHPTRWESRGGRYGLWAYRTRTRSPLGTSSVAVASRSVDGPGCDLLLRHPDGEGQERFRGILFVAPPVYGRSSCCRTRPPRRPHRRQRGRRHARALRGTSEQKRKSQRPHPPDPLLLDEPEVSVDLLGDDPRHGEMGDELDPQPIQRGRPSR